MCIEELEIKWSEKLEKSGERKQKWRQVSRGRNWGVREKAQRLVARKWREKGKGESRVKSGDKIKRESGWRKWTAHVL